jgi:hypothetical protein
MTAIGIPLSVDELLGIDEEPHRRDPSRVL